MSYVSGWQKLKYAPIDYSKEAILALKCTYMLALSRQPDLTEEDNAKIDSLTPSYSDLSVCSIGF
jgi:hypothetical protein